MSQPTKKKPVQQGFDPLAMMQQINAMNAMAQNRM